MYALRPTPARRARPDLRCRLLPGLLPGLLVAPALLLPLAAPALAAQPAGVATADAALVRVDAALPGLALADALVASASSSSGGTVPGTTSEARNADAALLGERVPGLLAGARQTAAPDHDVPESDRVLRVDGAPLLTAGVGQAQALARTQPPASTSCASGRLVSTSSSRLVDASVLPGQVAGGDLLALRNGRDPEGAVVSTTRLDVVPGTADRRALRSSASTQVTAVSLLGGALQVDVVTAPAVVATATGRPGGSRVALTQPVVRVGDQVLVAGQRLAPVRLPAGPVLELTVGRLVPAVGADGRTAAGEGALLDVRVLDLAGTPVAHAAVGEVRAAATVPAGGLSCTAGRSSGTLPDQDGLSARVDVSSAVAAPGGTFEEVVTVTNHGTAPLTGVVLALTPGASRGPSAELVGSQPGATRQDGDQATVPVGDLAPGQVRTVVVRRQVPPDSPAGAALSEDVLVTGTGPAGTTSSAARVDLPVVREAPGAGACDLRRSTAFPTHAQVRGRQAYSYVVDLYDAGGGPCRDVQVTQTLPEGATFVGCTAGCRQVGDQVVWTVEEVPAGGSRSVVLTVLAPAAGADGPLTAPVAVSTAGDRVVLPVRGPVVTGTSVPAAGVYPPAQQAAGDGSGTGDGGAAGGGADDGTGGGSGGSTGSGGVTVPEALPRTGAAGGALAALALVAAGLALRRRLAAA